MAEAANSDRCKPRNHPSAIAGSNPERVELWNICHDLADWENSKILQGKPARYW